MNTQDLIKYNIIDGEALIKIIEKNFFEDIFIGKFAYNLKPKIRENIRDKNYSNLLALLIADDNYNIRSLSHSYISFEDYINIIRSVVEVDIDNEDQDKIIEEASKSFAIYNKFLIGDFKKYNIEMPQNERDAIVKIASIFADFGE